MKNSAIVRIVIWSAVIVFLIAAAVVVMVNGGWGFSTGAGIGSVYKYSDSSSYSIGDFSANADEISSIDIEWISGSVNISEYDGDGITVSEDGFDDEDTKLRYRIKNGKLSIRFVKSGWRNGIIFGVGKLSLEKDLTILVPKGKQFRELDMELVSSSVEVNGISADDFDIDTVSGAVNIENLTTNDIDIEGVSGAITLKDVSARTADIENVSGAIDFSGTVREIDFNTVSGGITAEFSEVPEIVSIDSVSGSTDIWMPKTGISAEIDSVSGNVYAFGDKLGKSGEYTVGDGYMKLNVDTVSGGVEIEER